MVHAVYYIIQASAVFYIEVHITSTQQITKSRVYPFSNVKNLYNNTLTLNHVGLHELIRTLQ